MTVCFATPSLTHSVSMEFMRSSMETDWLLGKMGIWRAYINRCGDQFIANARSALACQFLDEHPYADDLFFLDDDLGWPPEKVLEFLQRDEDVLVGVYPKKSEEADWPVVLCGDDGALVEKDHLVRCTRAPTGFMRIKRRVLEALRPHCPKFKSMEIGGEVREWSQFFSSGIGSDGWFWTEDYAFCMNADAAGFEIWADPDIGFGHRGNRLWTGTFRDALPTFRQRAVEARESTAA